MKPTSLAGIVLIVLGILALTYQGITYTRHERVLDVGPIHASADTKERVPIPPILGALAIAGGIALLVLGSKRK